MSDKPIIYLYFKGSHYLETATTSREAVDKIIADNPDREAVVGMDYDKVVEDMETQYTVTYCSDKPTPITEEEYWEKLECLPPVRWHGGVFLMSEYLISNITNFIAKFKGDTGDVYYSANRRATVTNAEFLAECRAVHFGTEEVQ